MVCIILNLGMFFYLFGFLQCSIICYFALNIFSNSMNDILFLFLHDMTTPECLFITFSLDVVISRVSSRHMLHTREDPLYGAAFL
uniref:Uncharacterized protein n=1 Tax=Octopus bimaculoides TaxID=37653 RepID=A0A0L8HVQ3_OCTBM